MYNWVLRIKGGVCKGKGTTYFLDDNMDFKVCCTFSSVLLSFGRQELKRPLLVALGYHWLSLAITPSVGDNRR